MPAAKEEDTSEKKPVPWRAQEGPQLEAIRKHWVPEIFFGGAVGGGKSDYLLGDFAQDVPNYGEHWKGIIFRKSFPQLEELVSRALQIYPAWFCLDSKSAWRTGTHTFHWPNGAMLKFRHLEDDNAWTAYQGHQYSWMGFDELPHWATPKAYMELKTRVRNGAMKIPNKRIRATGNPGGVGHGWIKEYFGIDKHPLGGVIIEPEVEGGQQKMFIRSRVRDNKILLANDPGYIARLKDLGSEVLVKQYLDGDWSVVAGAYFGEFSPNQHIIEPFTIPKDWMRYRSMDWGSAMPFSVGWYAVSDGTVSVNGQLIPRGALVKYREWYGAKKQSNSWVGLKMDSELVAAGLLEREADGEVMNMSVIDPNAFKEDGGPSHVERMSKISRIDSAGLKHTATFHRGDNSRIAGWDMVRARLRGEHGRPMLYFFTTCVDSIRTLPGLQHDTVKPEDLDTDGEDHAADELRYACMSRPWVRKGDAAEEPQWANGMIVVPGKVICKTTFNDLVKQARARRLADS